MTLEDGRNDRCLAHLNQQRSLDLEVELETSFFFLALFAEAK